MNKSIKKHSSWNVELHKDVMEALKKCSKLSFEDICDRQCPFWDKESSSRHFDICKTALIKSASSEMQAMKNVLEERKHDIYGLEKQLSDVWFRYDRLNEVIHDLHERIKKEEPKLLTPEDIFMEIIPDEDNIVWIEYDNGYHSDFKGYTHISRPRFQDGDPTPVAVEGWFIGNDVSSWLYLWDYGKEWRAWTKKPSRNLMRNERWDSSAVSNE